MGNHTLRVISGLGYACLMLGAGWLSPWVFSLVILGLLILAIPELSALVAGDAMGPIVLGYALLSVSFASLAVLGFWIEAASLLTLLFAAFVFDTAAYYGGKLIGGPKLVPSISPNKTWAGLATGAVTIGIFHFLLTNFYIQFSFLSWGNITADEVNAFSSNLLQFTLILSVTFLSGDLLISMLKRRKGLKDSGKLIPGHGGILDRADSLLFLGPLMLAFPNLLRLSP